MGKIKVNGNAPFISRLAGIENFITVNKFRRLYPPGSFTLGKFNLYRLSMHIIRSIPRIPADGLIPNTETDLVNFYIYFWVYINGPLCLICVSVVIGTYDIKF